MNEKIKELPEQATKFDLETFANLIIDECIDEVMYHSDYFNTPVNQKKLVTRIKQRFGVE